MGSFSTSLAVGSAAYDPENEAKWIRSRREDDTVRAATQLPGITHILSSDSCRKSSLDSWNSIIGVIGSSNFSPAARRLATSLNFIAYIMKGKITSDKNWPREGYNFNFRFILFDPESTSTQALLPWKSYNRYTFRSTVLRVLLFLLLLRPIKSKWQCLFLCSQYVISLNFWISYKLTMC